MSDNGFGSRTEISPAVALGWALALFCLFQPDPASACGPFDAIDAGEAGTSGLAVGTVSGGARSYEPAAGTFRVTIETEDAGSAPLPARIQVRDSGGVYHPDAADSSFISRYDNWMKHYFYSDGSFDLWLPPGWTTVRAGRGFETETLEHGFTLSADTTFVFQLDRTFDMRALGWYGGDVHTHVTHDGGNGYMLDPEKTMRISRAEDLAVTWVMDNEPTLIGPHAVSDAEHLIYHSIEHRNQAYGHVALLGMETFQSTGCCTPPLPAAPTLSQFYESWNPSETQAMVLCHPRTNADFFKDDSWPGWGYGRGAPELAVHGALDAYDVVSHSNQPNIILEDWYRLLNAGFRVPPSAGTDAVSDRFFGAPPGSFRVFVKTGEEGLDAGAWVRELKAGRCFVTSYPLVPSFTVESVEAGGVVNTTAGTQLRVDFHVQSMLELDDATIVVNGEDVVSVPLFGAPLDQAFTRFVTVDEGSWIALRIDGTTTLWHVHNGTLFAHTGPVYVEVDGTPIHDTEPSSYFMDWADSLALFADIRGGWSNDDQRTEVMDRISTTKSFFQDCYVEPPAAFSLLDPPSDTTLTQIGEFSWEAAIDPEAGDRVEYLVEFAPDTTLLTQFFYSTSDTTLSIELLPQFGDGENFWRVTAEDLNDNVTRNSGGWRRFLVDGSLADAELPVDTGGLPTARIWVVPNPFEGDVSVHLRRALDQVLDVTVHDVTGRSLRSWTLPGGEAGLEEVISSFSWDATDESGRRVPAGPYWIRYANRVTGNEGAVRVVLVP